MSHIYVRVLFYLPKLFLYDFIVYLNYRIRSRPFIFTLLFLSLKLCPLTHDTFSVGYSIFIRIFLLILI